MILNRDGREHLHRCLRAIASTAYRDVEVIVVDNGSVDGSPELAEGLGMPFPVRVIRNTENRSFSEANAQGVAIANGTLVCLLNNDVEPITEDWLGSMVATMTRMGAVAVGARLIYPGDRGGPRGGARYPDLTLQHRGVDFDRTGPIPMPRPMGPGTDPMAPAAVAVEDRVALTAACLLVARSAFEAVGGLSRDYDYGLEDVDLCLRLRAAGGRLTYDGTAALWHHESATRVAVRAADAASSNARRARNHEAFVDRWGPRIYREALLDAIAGGTEWSDTPLHVGIAVGKTRPGDAQEEDIPRMLDDLGRAGWRVTMARSDENDLPLIEPSTEVLLVLDDAVDPRRLGGHTVTLAWVGDHPDRWLERAWFNEFDIALVPDQTVADVVRRGSAKSPTVTAGSPSSTGRPTASALREAMVCWVSAIRYGLWVGIPSWDGAEYRDDYRLARALQRALERDGHPTRLHLLPTWGDRVTARDDVSVHLSDVAVGRTRTGQINLRWQGSGLEAAGSLPDGRFDRVVGATGPAVHQAFDPEMAAPLIREAAESLLGARPTRVIPDHSV